MQSNISLGASYIIATLALCWSPCTANAEGTGEYQPQADRAEWSWHEWMANPLGCITQCGNRYDIRLLSKAEDRHAYTITILSGSREIYSWEGHANSVFRILDDRLYYARFHPSSSGGTIVAIDLNTGKEIWATPLDALGGVQHSAYRSVLNLHCNRKVVWLYGNESFGHYIEFKRIDTGETVGHKIFPKETPES